MDRRAAWLPRAARALGLLATLVAAGAGPFEAHDGPLSHLQPREAPVWFSEGAHHPEQDRHFEGSRERWVPECPACLQALRTSSDRAVPLALAPGAVRPRVAPQTPRDLETTPILGSPGGRAPPHA